MNTIADKWATFEPVLIGAGEDQRHDMKIAFFAGAQSTLALMLEIAEYSDAAGTAMLEGLHQECHRFAGSIVMDKLRMRSKA